MTSEPKFTDAQIEWAPKRIWLQNGVGEGGSHTWCEDQVLDDPELEVEYIRADQAARQSEVGDAVEIRLWDSQWMNVVNHADCYKEFEKDEAIALAVKKTEQEMARNFADGKWPSRRIRVFDAPCEKCGSVSVDTGWECNDCGHDNRPTETTPRPAVVSEESPAEEWMRTHAVNAHTAMTIAKNHAHVRLPDIDDRAYWDHEINALSLACVEQENFIGSRKLACIARSQ